MIYQDITACPGTHYTLSAAVQLAVELTATKKKPQPTCYVTLCESVSGICSDGLTLNTGSFTTFTKKIKTGKKQTTAEVQVYVYCEGTTATQLSKIYLDEIKFA
jgi:hypothetical protein